MMKTITLLFALSLLGLTACNDGPAEDLGARVDHAVNEAADAIDDACEDVRDAIAANNRNC